MDSDGQRQGGPRRAGWLDYLNTLLLAAALAAAGVAATTAGRWAEGLHRESALVQQSLRETARAYVMIEPAGPLVIERENVTGIPLRIANVGQTPARKLAIGMRGFAEMPEGESDWVWRYVARDGLPVRVGHLSGEMFETFTPDFPVNLDNVRRQGQRVYVVGIVYYDDILGEEHWTAFCFWWAGAATVGPEDATFCNRYNETDLTR
ncbi:MAG: hypothetical protein O3C09_03830 [Proteobacteria bacterium]|nr:hypothetical protein [Pseudomonadota bacterium]